MSAPVSFYADFQGLASLKSEAKAQNPAALKEAAKQFESLFTQMLLKSMREANRSFGDSLLGSDQGDFYQDMFDDQMAMHLSEGKGLGLAEMLIRQLSTSAGTDATSGADAAGPLPNPPPRSGGGDQRDAEPSDALFPLTRMGGERQKEAELSGALFPPSRSEGGQGGGIARHDAISNSKPEFVRMFLPHAERAAREIGVEPHALLAQAALETGWGRSVPRNARGEFSFNLFGIKAGGQWSGATVNVPTLEFEAGLPVRKVERFRSYQSAADSFRDYAALIRNNPRYENALQAGSDVASFASALQRGGYATDPGYARKIVAVASEVRALLNSQQSKSGTDT